MPSPTSRAAPLALLAALAGAVLPASARAAQQINTGEAAGAYHANFCPALSRELKVAQLDYPCVPSAGTRENIERVLADPRQLGYGQFDAFALTSRALQAEAALKVVRQDDVRECVFAVTRNKALTSYGDLAANAAKLRFVLPPKDSGSASTFEFLKTADTSGLGTARSVAYTESTDVAIRQALAADDTVSLFVQFADPDADSFRLVRELGGHIVPVIDRTILRQEIGGRKIYYAQETQIANADWVTSARKVVTACTPMILFTGSPDAVKGEQARKDHEDVIRTVAALKPGALLPQESLFQRLLKRSRELSAASTEKILELSDQAREKAKPYSEKAGEVMKETADQTKRAAERAAEAAKPYYDKSKEAAREALDEARRVAKDILDRAKEKPRE